MTSRIQVKLNSIARYWERAIAVVFVVPLVLAVVFVVAAVLVVDSVGVVACVGW